MARLLLADQAGSTGLRGRQEGLEPATHPAQFSQMLRTKTAKEPQRHLQACFCLAGSPPRPEPPAGHGPVVGTPGKCVCEGPAAAALGQGGLECRGRSPLQACSGRAPGGRAKANAQFRNGRGCEPRPQGVESELRPDLRPGSAACLWWRPPASSTLTLSLDKAPEDNDLAEGGIYSGSWFQRGLSTVAGGETEHHGQGRVGPKLLSSGPPGRRERGSKDRPGGQVSPPWGASGTTPPARHRLPKRPSNYRHGHVTQEGGTLRIQSCLQSPPLNIAVRGPSRPQA